MQGPTLLVPGSLRLGPGAPPGAADEAPIDYITGWVKRRMPEFGGHSAELADRILIVRSETGSGKSTVLPVALFRLLRAKETAPGLRYRGRSLICTQPRVLTARALALDVSSRPWNPDMVLGQTVGYTTGPFSLAPPAGLLYATAGVLSALLQRAADDAELMDRYRFIIVDEAHERSLESDMMLMLLRHWYLRNRGNERLPFLLLTSATFEVARYAAFFGVGEANTVEVVGRAFPIETHWPAHGANDWWAAAAETVVRIHREHPDDPPGRGDVLVFVPGAAAMADIERRLVKASREEVAAAAAAGRPAATFLVLTVDRQVVNSEGRGLSLVFAAPDTLPWVGGAPVRRRVILSTVVAETGLTIDSLRYVVDSGWAQSKEAYPQWGVAGLVLRPAPRSRIQQRKGRAGRLFAGDFYPLYTENVWRALEEQQPPDIVTAGASAVFLAIARALAQQAVRTGRPTEFRVEEVAAAMLTPPPPAAMLAALTAAVQLGFVSPRAPQPRRWPPPAAGDPAPPDAAGNSLAAAAAGYGLTPLGHLAAALAAGGRLSMEAARVLLAGYCWGAAAQDLATIVALFDTRKDDWWTQAERERGNAKGPRVLPPGALALKAALPPFLGRYGHRGGAEAPVFPPTEEESYWWRARLLIADDFVEHLLILDGAIARLGHNAAATTDGQCGVWDGFAEHCAAVGLDAGHVRDVLRARDEVMEAMVAAGLNPFRLAERRLAVAGAADFTAALVRVKRCLYDGLRLRVLTRDDRGVYRTAQGLAVQTPDLFRDDTAERLRALAVIGARGAAAAAQEQAAAAPAAQWLRPRHLLTDQVALRAAPRPKDGGAPPLLWAPAANYVSVLSGYVDPDPEMAGPRRPAPGASAPEV